MTEENKKRRERERVRERERGSGTVKRRPAEKNREWDSEDEMRTPSTGGESESPWGLM